METLVQFIERNADQPFIAMVQSALAMGFTGEEVAAGLKEVALKMKEKSERTGADLFQVKGGPEAIAALDDLYHTNLIDADPFDSDEVNAAKAACRKVLGKE